MTDRGRLIVLEGGEGAGKSTQAVSIADWLRGQGREVLVTREPGGSPLAEAIRRVVLSEWSEGMHPLTELLLIFAARNAHWRGTIEPALARGIDVVCDRFIDSSYAYQGGGRGLDFRLIARLERIVLGDVRPDLVLLLDLPPEQGLRRARAREDANRFEAEDLEFQRRVRRAYLRRLRRAPQRFVRIDAAQPLETVREAIIDVLRQRLESKA